MIGKPTKTPVLSYWELTDSEPAAREPAWDQPRPSAWGWQLRGLVRGALAVGPEPVPGA